MKGRIAGGVAAESSWAASVGAGLLPGFGRVYRAVFQLTLRRYSTPKSRP